MIGLILKEAVAEYGRISISGLGTFTGTKHPASLHFADRTISPGTLEINFEREIHSEGIDFTTLVQSRFEVSEEQAYMAVDSWVKHANHSLDFTHRFEIAGFGLLRPDMEGNVQFEPKSDTNYNTQSFGLPVLKAEMLAARFKKQDRETPIIPLHPYEPDTRTRTSGFKWNIGWVSGAAVFVALVASFGVVFYLSNDAILGSQTIAYSKIADQPQKAVLVPEITVPKTKDESTPALPKENTEKTQQDLQGKEQVTREILNSEDVSFYVVAGSFRMNDKSRERQGQLKNEGYETELLFSKEKSLTRVTIGKFATKHEAIRFLTETQPKFEDQLWVLAE